MFQQQKVCLDLSFRLLTFCARVLPCTTQANYYPQCRILLSGLWSMVEISSARHFAAIYVRHLQEWFFWQQQQQPSSEKEGVRLQGQQHRQGQSPAPSPHCSVEDATPKRNKTTSLTVHLTAGRTTLEGTIHRWWRNIKQKGLQPWATAIKPRQLNSTQCLL